VLVRSAVTTRSTGPSYSTRLPLLRQIFETARRVLAQNRPAVRKQLSAEQESAYEVGAVRVPRRGGGKPRGCSRTFWQTGGGRPGMGDTRFSTAGTRSANTSRDASSSGNSLPAGARPLAGRGRRSIKYVTPHWDRARSRRPRRVGRSPGACCPVHFLQEVEQRSGNSGISSFQCAPSPAAGRAQDPTPRNCGGWCFKWRTFAPWPRSAPRAGAAGG